MAAAGWQWQRAQTAPLSLADHEQAMLTRIVDLLVPRDETPGALDLGLHLPLIERMYASATSAQVYGELLRTPSHAGCTAAACRRAWPASCRTP